MQRIVFDDPYEFVPPFRSRIWSKMVGKILPTLMRRMYGVVSWETHGLDHLRASLEAGHGIILCPNHSRASDPMAMGSIVLATPCEVYAMASWHVFRQSRLETLVCRSVGAFSVYREGLDRKALELATEVVTTAERPLVIFAEGVISAANDRLLNLMDGIAFVARTAAKKRIKINPDAKVVVHPVACRYSHSRDPAEALLPTLDRLESMLFWQTNQHMDVAQRVAALDEANQSLREVQYLGHAREGSVPERAQWLANEILQNQELEWLGGKRTGDVVSRVKDLRLAMIPDMVSGAVDDAERQRRWRFLTELYFAQTMSMNVPGYLDRDKAGDRFNYRLVETLERVEEDLTDKLTTYDDMHIDIHVGEPIEVDPSFRRGRGPDPLMTNLRQNMLDLMQTEEIHPPQPVADVPNKD